MIPPITFGSEVEMEGSLQVRMREKEGVGEGVRMVA